uniref:Uncharacterized protein n=1 Tax=Octopus bimaculoides TaxID=37653 RepID=A0A0L8I930_OCTBM
MKLKKERKYFKKRVVLVCYVPCFMKRKNGLTCSGLCSWLLFFMLLLHCTSQLFNN